MKNMHINITEKYSIILYMCKTKVIGKFRIKAVYDLEQKISEPLPVKYLKYL